MEDTTSYSLTRYLDAKRTVDDRALNRRVWADFLTSLSERQSEGEPLSILDVAGGIGSTTWRVLESYLEAGTGAIHCTLVDIDPILIREAKRFLPEWARKAGFSVQAKNGRVEIAHQNVCATITLVCADAFDFLREQAPGSYDGVVTQAWLDLVHLETALEEIFRVLAPSGLFYAPIHFDGETRFLPVIDEKLDRQVLDAYHRSMDLRHTAHGPARGSRTGSRMIIEIPEAGGRILSAGSSDWIVRPNRDGDYPHDEAHFLFHILRFVDNEIQKVGALSSKTADRWLKKRSAQVDTGTLRYMAHQLDVLAVNDTR